MSQGPEKEVAALTERIQKVEMARGLAEAGLYQKALEILYKLRDAYTEERQVKRVEWLIRDVERKRAASDPDQEGV